MVWCAAKRHLDGEEYIEYRERSTKTITGVTSESRSFAPKMFENRDIYCQIYENIYLKPEEIECWLGKYMALYT